MDRTASLEEIVRFTSNPELVSYCAMGNRLGMRGWMTEVEFTWFMPDTLLNDNFYLSLMKWPDDFPIPWVIITIPREYETRATALLWNHGLKIGGSKDPDPEGGLYCFVMFDSKGAHQFPLVGVNIHCLENHSEGTQHVAYTNDPEKLKAAREHEEEVIIGKFHEEHRLWLNTVEGRLVARAYWATHPGVDGPEPEYSGPPIPEEDK